MGQFCTWHVHTYGSHSTSNITTSHFSVLLAVGNVGRQETFKKTLTAYET
jgi:hypothetical protein